MDRRGAPGEEGVLARSFAHTLEALVQWKHGQAEDALRLLDEARLQIPWLFPGNSPFHEQPLDRYIRAEILFDEGRYEEALPWFASLLEGYVELGAPYLGPSYFRRAQIYEQLGDQEKALAYYSRLIELWKDCDPSLRLMVEQAEERLQHLLERNIREPGYIANPKRKAP